MLQLNGLGSVPGEAWILSLDVMVIARMLFS